MSKATQALATQPGSHRIFSSNRLKVPVFLVLAIAVFLISSALQKLHAADDKALTDSQIAEANKPGTVLIKTQWTSKISVGRERIDLDRLVQYAVNQAELLGIPATRKAGQNAMVKAMFDELLNHPELYLIPSSQEFITEDVHTAGTGSGFIVTPDGYIVTNAHVVDEDTEDLKNDIVSGWETNELAKIFLADFDAFKEKFEHLEIVGKQGIEDKERNFVEAEVKYYFRNIKILSTRTEVSAQMGVAIPGLPTQALGIPCEVKPPIGESITKGGKDVAILKVEQDNLPTVPLGDDKTMKDGETIIVLGYPGAADINQKQRGVESTLTNGILSARKDIGGWSVLQTSAEINPGNSGGPAFNDRGEVIGIAAAHPRDPSVRGINFLVPISVVKEFLNEKNIKPQESRLSKLYQEGIVSMTKECYKGALEKFKEIGDLSPGFPFVQDKITQSHNAIDQGLDRCWMPSSTYLIGAVAIVLLILTAVWLLMRRRTQFADGVLDTNLQKGSGEGAVQSYGSVQGTSGPMAGKRFEVTKDGLLIGRDASKCQIVVNDDAVSKEHAWIVPVDGGTVVIDRGSSNGTFVNSVNSPKVSKVRLQNGDKIFIGKGVATFTYLSS